MSGMLAFCSVLLHVIFVRSMRVLPKDINFFDQSGSVNSTFVKEELMGPHMAGMGRRQLMTAKDHLVTDLPGLKEPLGSDHYAGLLPVDETGANSLFYWLFEAPTNPLDKPLIIWLNGGPGCSSMDGLFLELGKCYIPSI